MMAFQSKFVMGAAPVESDTTYRRAFCSQYLIMEYLIGAGLVFCKALIGVVLVSRSH